MGNTREPHEVIYEQALRRIAALDETWQEAVRGTAAVPPPAPVVAAPVVAAPVVVAPPAPVPGPLATQAIPPLPRAPMTATAEITAIGPDTAEAVLARSAAPRWRRSLAY